MIITNLKVINFRSARQLELDLEPRLNLFVGVNGAGKSTVLDAMAIMLSWAAARMRSPNASGRRILDTDIHNEKNFSWIELDCKPCQAENDRIRWRLTQTRKGRNPDVDPNDPLHGMTSFKELNNWAGIQRDRIGEIGEHRNLPLFVYYPVNRSVLDIPLRIRTSHSFGLLDAYDGALTAGANFRSFFEWYRNREDIENELLRDTGVLKKDPQLQAVRLAIMKFLPEFSDISVKRNPLRMEVTKSGAKYRVEQMSDGEKCLFAMVGDLARRLAIANPARENPLQGEGVVLIDEIDLHLHPVWQRSVIRQLTTTFPNCQIILSTHSPQVFGEVDAHCIRRLSVEPLHGLVSSIPKQALGLDSAEILEEEMEGERRNTDIADQLEEIFNLIDDECFSDAQLRIGVLRDKVGGSIPELVRAESLIAMLAPCKEAHL